MHCRLTLGIALHRWASLMNFCITGASHPCMYTGTVLVQPNVFDMCGGIEPDIGCHSPTISACHRFHPNSKGKLGSVPSAAHALRILGSLSVQAFRSEVTPRNLRGGQRAIQHIRSNGADIILMVVLHSVRHQTALSIPSFRTAQSRLTFHSLPSVLNTPCGLPSRKFPAPAEMD
jgi:hypothetical protein